MAHLAFAAATAPGQAPKIYCVPHPGQPPCKVEEGYGPRGEGGGKG
ncbi:MAG: hypothetical protein JWM87_283 [Candidatus Eremiobacteraeota bacterium]|nr:hypothetical protein [Candidatus Eremiobacteraeota bacterium]